MGFDRYSVGDETTLSIDSLDNGLTAFCATQPVFRVPAMGCPEGQVMVAIDACGRSPPGCGGC